jgi:hypothetical protein
MCAARQKKLVIAGIFVGSAIFGKVGDLPDYQIARERGETKRVQSRTTQLTRNRCPLGTGGPSEDYAVSNRTEGLRPCEKAVGEIKQDTSPLFTNPTYQLIQIQKCDKYAFS